MRLYILVLLLLTQFIYAQNKQNWSYKDNTAPQYWANLNPLYLGCAEGNQQSPINIVTKNVSKGAAQFELKYSVAKGVNLMLSNHAFKMIYPQGNFLEMNGNRYQLKEIYFKTPGENAINSLRGILEAQFLHEDSKGHKVILAVFFVEGRSNPIIKSLVKNLPHNQIKQTLSQILIFISYYQAILLHISLMAHSQHHHAHKVCDGLCLSKR